MPELLLLTRFEVARLVGMRSLQLSEGEYPNVMVQNRALREDTMYVAALELSEGKLDAKIVRSGRVIDVREAHMPQCLHVTLDSRDGGMRSYSVTSVSAKSL